MNAHRAPITTHILDVAQGKPAAGVAVRLEKDDGPSWRELSRGTTNADGRVEELLPKGSKAERGVYRLTFFVKTAFYPEITVVFELANPDQHYHVPLLLSPYGYSTYRGS